MDIIVKGGMYNCQREEYEKVIYFGPNIFFFQDFDPRAINAGSKKIKQENTHISLGQPKMVLIMAFNF